MNPLYRKASFLTSAAKLSQTPEDTGYEVAFAGRSNAGKSTAINTLCDQRGLAKTSKTPGRTQLLNFFELDEDRRLVDLPGYGFAKVAIPIKQQWQGVLSEYLEHRDCIRGLILMADSRHLLKDYDRQMLEWSMHINLPVHILLTKADKLKNSAARNQLFKLQKDIENYGEKVSAQLFSGLKKQGISEAHKVLDQWFEY